jgi:hypothetical protein
MRRPTELTIEASVMKGVQNAPQRARRRSSLSSSKLFFGNGLSNALWFPSRFPVVSGWYSMSAG